MLTQEARDNLKSKLPDKVGFEKLISGRKYGYVVVDKRPPKAGEWYLSGAIVGAWYAQQSLSTEYIIVRPLLDP